MMRHIVLSLQKLADFATLPPLNGKIIKNCPNLYSIECHTSFTTPVFLFAPDPLTFSTYAVHSFAERLKGDLPA